MANKPTPKAKPKGLNDFLKEGKRPPSKNKKLPSDADVIIKGYNDKKTVAKEKLKADMKSGKMKRLESGMTGAMVAKAAGKVIPKVVKRAALVAKNQKSAKNNMKIVNKVADLQQKTKAETIAKNSVKVKGAKDDAVRRAINSESSAKTMTAKSGAAARYYAGQVENKRKLPAKVIKIKSK